jgi:hypothetical protein
MTFYGSLAIDGLLALMTFFRIRMIAGEHTELNINYLPHHLVSLGIPASNSRNDESPLNTVTTVEDS